MVNRLVHIYSSVFLLKHSKCFIKCFIHTWTLFYAQVLFIFTLSNIHMLINASESNLGFRLDWSSCWTANLSSSRWPPNTQPAPTPKIQPHKNIWSFMKSFIIKCHRSNFFFWRNVFYTREAGRKSRKLIQSSKQSLVENSLDKCILYFYGKSW